MTMAIRSAKRLESDVCLSVVRLFPVLKFKPNNAREFGEVVGDKDKVKG